MLLPLPAAFYPTDRQTSTLQPFIGPSHPAASIACVTSLAICGISTVYLIMVNHLFRSRGVYPKIALCNQNEIYWPESVRS